MNARSSATSAFLLVHSPLVGPSTWTPTANALRARGYAVVVPDLTGVADAPPSRWAWFAREAADAAGDLGDPVWVVGHSGAGAALPAIGAHLGPRLGGLAFIDAVVPPTHGAHETPARQHELLDQRTTDATLLRWFEWWDEEVTRELVPDPDQWRALLDEMPRLPRALYDEPVEVPAGWSEGRCVYLQLSAPYTPQRGEAEHRGWACGSLDADHLAITTRPELVVDGLLGLLTS